MLVFREEVVAHYRTKGYKVHEGVKVRGQSGAVHACDLIAQGPLGNLVVSFGDYGGFDGPEMGAVRRAARDVGATPVVAAESMPEGIRQLAARAGVVLLDRACLRRPEPVVPEESAEPQATPWPDPERKKIAEPEPRPAPSRAPAEEAFGWLPKTAVPRAQPVARVAPAPQRIQRPATTEPVSMVRVVVFAAVTGLSAGAAFFGLSLLF